MIYFIGCAGANAVKIGTTRQTYLSPDATAYARLCHIQASCPLELELLAVCPGHKAEEAALHEQFQALRIRGEWFRLTGELAAFIAKYPKPVRRPRGWNGGKKASSISNSSVSSLFPAKGAGTATCPAPAYSWAV
jgi:hypothetical protein